MSFGDRYEGGSWGEGVTLEFPTKCQMIERQEEPWLSLRDPRVYAPTSLHVQCKTIFAPCLSPWAGLPLSWAHYFSLKYINAHVI